MGRLCCYFTLDSSIAQGLAEVQSGKGFSLASGTFSIQELNMGWTASIQKITEDKICEAQIKEVMALQEQEANRPWYQKTAISTWGFMEEFFKGASSAALENVFGIEPSDNDELESKLTYQAGRLTGNVVAGAASIIEILEGLTIIGGANFLTLVAEAGTGGLASPIAIPLDAAATTAGIGLISHGTYVGGKTFQNSVDTLQKFQSSSSSGGRVNKVKETDRLDKEGNGTQSTGKDTKETSEVKFSEMTADEQIKIAKEYSMRAPIKIPENVKIKPQSKTGYEQITYKWSDESYKYEVRWHTRTPGAPENQGNTWVVQRTIPGNGGNKPQTFFKIGDNEWVEGHKWYDAISARKSGTATPEQIKILEKGHWKD